MWKLTEWQTSPSILNEKFCSDTGGLPVSYRMDRYWHRFLSEKVEESTLAVEIVAFLGHHQDVTIRACQRPPEDWHVGDSPPPGHVTMIEQITDYRLPEIKAVFTGMRHFADASLSAIIRGCPMVDQRIQSGAADAPQKKDI